MEKLRRQLQKEEKRIAKAEAQASKNEVVLSTEVDQTDVSALDNPNKKRKRSDCGEFGNANIEDADLIQAKPREAASTVPGPLTPTSQPALADDERNPPPKALNADGTPGHLDTLTGPKSDESSFPNMAQSIQGSSVSMSDSSSDLSSTVSEDSTSSSGSSSNRDNDDEAPEETSTKRTGLERVAPPKRAKQKQICREFLHKGLCKRGSRCKYLHELPERGSRGAVTQEIKRAEGRKERVGLYQRVSRHV